MNKIIVYMNIIIANLHGAWIVTSRKKLAPDRRRRRKTHGESCKDVILELSRLATGPLEHLVEINSLNAHLYEYNVTVDHGFMAL